MSHDPGKHEGKVAGALEKMPYDVVKAVADLAKSAAQHCAAARVWPPSAPGGGKDAKRQRDEVGEHYQKFEAASAALKEHGEVLAPRLRDSLSALLWSSGWHAANAVGDMLDKAEDEEEEEERPSTMKTARRMVTTPSARKRTRTILTSASGRNTQAPRTTASTTSEAPWRRSGSVSGRRSPGVGSPCT
ncbi:unnamed protein product [Prorocentrum cordatum]|uniref:Uncharacterized protein n=1 Tax=Prorocentrum cordatum TaxID=2364126 RepID=A0ABN9UHJ2_9DINO|nr:unnamed protein product [Polarella glacialis]